MALAALEAVLDARSDAEVRACWAAVADAGLPSQSHHGSATNAPHVTLVSAPTFGPTPLAVARTVLAPHVPLEVTVAGWVVFGAGPRYTLALLCSVPTSLVGVVDKVTRTAAGERPGAWVPHLTVARRLSRGDLERAMSVVDASGLRPKALVLSGVRHWDPVSGTVSEIA